MFAALPMYLTPETRRAHDRFWELVRDGLRARGIDAPETLNHDTQPMEGWARDDLVLGQICNLPYRARFRDRLTRIGASDYGVEDAPPGHYHSVFVVRSDDPATTFADCDGYRLAFNEGLSQSGWAAPSFAAARQNLTLRPVGPTGAHAASMRAVANHRADMAAIDCITFAIAKDSGQTTGLKVIGHSDPSPGMTFVTAKDRDPEPLLGALRDGLAELDPETAATLRLHDVLPLPDAAYDLPLPKPPQ